MERAALIHKTDQEALTVYRGQGHQREHMADDKIAFDAGQSEILFGIAERYVGVAEAGKPVRGVGVVPVIEEVVMQQGSTHQRWFIHAQMEGARQKQTVESHSFTMEKARGCPMLRVAAHLGNAGASYDRRGQFPETPRYLSVA